MEYGHTPHPVVLFGREPEQHRLDVALKQAIAGQGGLVLVSGEAGIGKSALVDCVVRAVHELGVLVLRGSCYDLTTTPPYGAWIEMARGYPSDEDSLPRLPGVLRTREEVGFQRDVFEQITVFLADLAARGSVVVLLEDMHWSDEVGLDLLRCVARDVAQMRLLLVVTYRDDEVAERRPLYQLLPLLVRESRVTRIELRRLPREAVRQWIGARYQMMPDDEWRLVEYLERYGEGNPLYIHEVLHTLEAERAIVQTEAGWQVFDLSAVPIPSLLRHVIDGRLQRLDTTTREALGTAAAIGQEVPLDLWNAVSGIGGEQLFQAVASAVDAHLLVEAPGGRRLIFSHALIRESLYAGLVPLQRRALHQRIADAILGTVNPDPDVVAHHFEQAGDERVLEWLIRAGLRARRSAAWIAAADRLRAAAQLLDGDDARIRERGWLLAYSGFLSRFSDDPQVIDYLDEAERLAVAANDHVLAAYVRCHRGSARCVSGEIRRGLTEIRAGIATLDSLSRTDSPPSIDEQALAVIANLLSEGSVQQLSHWKSWPGAGSPHSFLVTWLGSSGHYREAIQVGEVLLEEAKAECGDESHQLLRQCRSVWLGLGLSYGALGQPDEAQRAFEVAREGFAITGDHVVVDIVTSNQLTMSTIPYRADRPAERAKLVADAQRSWSLAPGMVRNTSDQSPCHVLIDLIDGRWTDAARLARADRCAPNAFQTGAAIVTLATLARNQSQPDLAWKLVYELHPDGPKTEAGDSEFCRAIAAQMIASELALDAGNLDRAREWIEAQARWLDWSGATLWRSAHDLLWARYYWKIGDLERGRAFAEQSVAKAITPRQPLALTAAHRFLGRFDTQGGNFESAAFHLKESSLLAEACAAPHEQALTWLAIAEFQSASGNVEEAQLSVERAKAICLPMEAARALTDADKISVGLSASPAAPMAFPDKLTAREVEVLRHIATGKTNREIAEHLFLSKRTVERHIANIYSKIGVQNKAAATAYVLHHRLS